MQHPYYPGANPVRYRPYRPDAALVRWRLYATPPPPSDPVAEPTSQLRPPSARCRPGQMAIGCRPPERPSSRVRASQLQGRSSFKCRPHPVIRAPPLISYLSGAASIGQMPPQLSGVSPLHTQRHDAIIAESAFKLQPLFYQMPPHRPHLTMPSHLIHHC